MSVADWLRAANVTLDERNEAVHPDESGNYAPRRTTGISVRIRSGSRSALLLHA